MSVQVTVLLLQRDNVTMAYLIKENIELELAYSFRCSVHYHHDKHDRVQVDMVLEKLLSG